MNNSSNNETDKVSIVIAEDHTLVRKGIRTILEGHGEDYLISGEAETADQALDLVSNLDPQILLLDLNLPAKSGLEVIHALKEKNAPVKIIVLTMDDSEEMAKQALLAGADSYILKDFTPSALIKAIVKTLAGECVLPEKLTHLEEEIQSISKEQGNTKQSDPLYKLSKREREVFFYIANGMPNRDIAKKLFISPRTVETHRARVIKKLGFKTTADIIKYAIKTNLMNP